MKKLSVKGARVLAAVILLSMTICFGIFCFYKDRAVTIVSGESYVPIYKGREDKPCVALMFNVYENTEVVNKILDLLNEKQVKATFFVGGCWADDNTPTVKRIVDDGHTIGNHGYFHKNHKKLSESQNFIEIKTCHDLVFNMTGVKMNLFAPPSGAFSKTTLIVVEKSGYRTVMWSKDTIDWRDFDVNTIIERAKKVQNGDFVLMHPKAHTLKALPEIIDFYKEKGIAPVTVDACLK